MSKQHTLVDAIIFTFMVLLVTAMLHHVFTQSNNGTAIDIILKENDKQLIELHQMLKNNQHKLKDLEKSLHE